VHKHTWPDDTDSPLESDMRYEHEYGGLDAFTNASDSETDTESAGVESQEMSAEDTAAAAGFFVDTGAGFVESMFSVPVTIDHDTKQVIAQKAVPVIAKYAKGATLPPWLVRYREEFELVGVLMMAGLSIYKQINAQKKADEKAENVKAEKTEKSNMEFSPLGEVLFNGG